MNIYTVAKLKSTSARKAYSRARVWAGILAVLAFPAAWLLYGTMTDPERMRRRCEAYLGRFIDGEVTVENATFGFFTGIHLDGVRVTESSATSSASSADHPFFYCRNLLLKHDPLAMLVGKLSVEEVVAINPLCNLVRASASGDYNISRIFRGSSPGGRVKKPRLPVVRLRNASLIIARETEGKRRDVDRITLSVVATPESETARSYSVAWKRGGPEPVEGRSRFNLRTLSFKDLKGGLPWLSLETGMLVVATQIADADRWFGLLGLTGQIKAEDYDLSLRAGPGERGRLTVRLRDASLSIPIDEAEQSLPRAERYLRFDDVEGTVELSQTRAEVQFGGTFHGAPCRVVARLTGDIDPQADLEDVAVSATITCEDFTLPLVGTGASPAAVRFVRRWRPLRSFYNDFDPHGRVALEITVTKAAGTGQPVRLERGVMTVLHADGSYRKFPYRVGDITGSVQVTPEGIYLRELAGNHEGAPIVVNGWLAEARWYSASELHITGRGVTLDADLHSALNERYRKLWDTFALAGSADITVEMGRGPGTAEKPQPYTTAIKAELTSARARFAGFPYPVEDLSGGVAVSGDRLTVTRLTGRNGPARVVVDGYAELADEGLSDLHLRLEAEHLTFDDRLFGALPEEARNQVADFAPQGTFDLAGDITFDPSAGRATYDLAATLRDVQITYRAVPVPVEHVSGTIRLQPNHVAIERLTGRRGECTVTVVGAFSSGADRADARALITCEYLVADQELLAALPEGVGGVCRDLRITGPVKTGTHYESQGTDAAAGTHRTVIDAAGASIDPVSFPYPLAITRGTVTVEPGHVVIGRLHAAHGDTTVTLDGTLAFDDQAVEGDFTLSGKHIVLDEDLRLAVPWRWRRTWNKISPTGTIDLELESLDYHRNRGAASADWVFDGRLVLNGTGLDVGVRVRDAAGVLQGQGEVCGEVGELSASAALTLDTLSVNDRRVENVRGQLEKSAVGGYLVLRDMSGELYDGLISADVEVRFEPGAAQYDVSATMQDVDLRYFLRAGKGASARTQPVAGKLDAHIFMGGAGGDAESRRGGGKVSIRNADLYRLPLIAAILNVINFTIPEESAFQEMSAEFFVTGRRVEVKDIVLQGTALALVGSGTVVPTTQTLALKLVAVTPHRWVQVPVITEFLEGAAREMLEIDVHGPLGDPRIEAKPLRGIEAAFETLFEKKKPKKPGPVAPI